MDDKFLSGEEKRAKLKEIYKKDLLERKKILQKINAQKHLNKISSALEDMNKILTGDDTDEWIQKLNQKSTLTEAKLDTAVDMIPTIETQPTEQQPKIEESTTEKTIGDLSSIEKIPDPSQPPTNKTLF
ncbi:MAG: hypothetical protein NZ108_01720 [Bacteroidia bacterium]|nr:hypothetical protein [Bacteroidia bacterium]